MSAQAEAHEKRRLALRHAAASRSRARPERPAWTAELHDGGVIELPSAMDVCDRCGWRYSGFAHCPRCGPSAS